MNDRNSVVMAAQERALRKALRRCHEGARLLRALFDGAVQGFAVAGLLPDEMDPGYRILEANESFRRLVGVTFPTYANESGKRRGPRWLDRFVEVALKGGSVEFEARLPESGRWVEVSAYGIGQRQFAILLTDITARKQAQQEEVERFKLAEAVFTHSISGLVVLDRNYNFLRVNEAYARACRRPITDFPGRNHFEMFPSDAKLIFDEVVSTKRTFTAATSPFLFTDQPERGVTYWDWTLVPVLDELGEVGFLVLSLMEVTERKRAEEALHASEARYRQQAAELALIYRSAPVGLCVLDTQLRYQHINERLAELNGIPVADHIGKQVREVVPVIAVGAEPLLRRVLESGQPVLDVELSGETHSQPGVQRAWIGQYWPLKSEEGEVLGINVVVEEVTERRHLAAALQREREFRTLAENSTDVVARLDRGLHVAYVNPAVETLFGRPAAEFLGKHLGETGLPGELTEFLRRELSSVVATGQRRTVEFSLETQRGERFLDARLVPEFDGKDEVETVLTITRDITERRSAETALRESEAKYRTLVENLYEGIWLIDDKADTTFVNARMAELLGYRPDEMLGRNINEFMSPQAVVAAEHNLARGRGGVRAEYDFEFLRKDGRSISTHIVTTPLFDAEGRYTGALAGVTDITERKRAEEALFRREQEFEALAERSPDIVARVDHVGHLTYINPAIERITGRPREWYIGRSQEELELTLEERAERHRILRKVFHDRVEQVLVHGRPTPEGTRYFQARLVPELGRDGRVESALVVERDITDLKQAQFALEELSLHDPLTGVANRRYLTQFIEREWKLEARHRHCVALIMADVDHFKAYNDRYGHQGGDECLRQVAQALRSQLHRATDLLVRYGGEEFALVLPETELPAAARLAETLRRAVEELQLPHADSPAAEVVTISAGVAATPADRGTFPELLAAADQALYRAKERGRNRVATVELTEEPGG